MTEEPTIEIIEPGEERPIDRLFDVERDYHLLSLTMRQRLENQPLIDVFLHGPLAAKYGGKHQLAVLNPREAVAALNANFPGFLADFAASENYQIVVDGEFRGGELAALGPVAKELHFIPQVEGGAFLIVPLVTAAATAMGISISATAASIIGGVIATGLLIGLALLLRPKQPKPDEETRDSYSFTGPENVIGQGVAVPIVYGRAMCGSIVVSIGIETTTVPGGDELRSAQRVKIVDVISEGVIAGFGGGGGYRGIYLDGVVFQNQDGTLNFPAADFYLREGYRTQPLIPGQYAVERENVVSVQLKQSTGVVTRTITDPNVDAVRFTVSTPALYNVDTKSGRYDPYTAQWLLTVPGYSYTYTLNGKTTSRFQQQIVFNLPPGGAPWNITAQRLSADETATDHANDTYWDSFTELYWDRVNYAHTALVGAQFNAESFSDIPDRTYDIYGVIVLVPNNYDPQTGIYYGSWSGTFKAAWTNNPAWVLYDLITNNRYGLGAFIPAAMVDKFFLYDVGVWCDQQVPNGKGGYERRFTCNVQIRDQQEAFDLLNDIAGVFRGFTFWAGGMLKAIADKPASPVMQFTNADVLDGQFSYQGSDIRARHTQVATTWQNPALIGETQIAVAEDYPKLLAFGIQRLDLDGIGITSEGQAVRNSKWALYTELYEAEVITFSAGHKAAFLEPGAIIRVADVNISGKRRGGRIKTASGSIDSGGTTHSLVTFDAPVWLDPFHDYQLACMIGADQHVEIRPAGTGALTAGYYDSIGTTPAFTNPPLPDTGFILIDPGDLEPTLWRVQQVQNTDVGRYDINAVRHLTGKWAYVEQGIAITEPDVTDIVNRYPAVTNLKAVEYLVALSAISVGVRVTLSWTSAAPAFDVSWRQQNGNWKNERVATTAIDLDVEEGPWQFRVIPISAIGLKGTPATINYYVTGRYAPPLAPKQFRVKVTDSVALFEWLPSTELDVIIGGHFELRHSSRTSGANWASAQVVIPSIPGSATTVEAVYRVGTWFLRTFDIVGLQSTEVATIVAYQPDGRYSEFVRICENPDFLGSRLGTEVLEPQQWLVLGQTGGLWDDQTDDMDDWPDVDVLPGGVDPPQSEARYGWYLFEDRIDAGGIFTVRFSADILAFPFQEGSTFIDDRLDNCDDWQSWDDESADLNGQVQLFIRTTDGDPADPGASWSDWQIFSPTEYTARGFEFRADLFAPIGQNIAVEELCITADLRMKMDSAEDIVYPAATTHVAFKVKFYLVPAVVVTVQDALATDKINIVAKDREGFDIDITNAGSQVTRVFDWQARGY